MHYALQSVRLCQACNSRPDSRRKSKFYAQVLHQNTCKSRCYFGFTTSNVNVTSSQRFVTKSAKTYVRLPFTVEMLLHELPHMLPKTWTIRKVKGQSHEASISCPSIIKIFLILLIHLPPQSRASRDDDVLLFVCLFVCLFECLFACRQRVMIDHWPVLAAGWRP